MKIGIITFHNSSNYGAVLQTYALQEALKKEKRKIEIINYKNDFIMKGLRSIRAESSIHGIYYTIVDLINYKTRNKKIKRFKEFFKYYNLSNLVTKEELKYKNLNYDYIISGSDQIWNPLLNNGFDDIYFGNIFKAKKRISYASSFGNYKLNDQKLNKELLELLKPFVKISVRENAAGLERIIERKVSEVCDPTLLLSKEEWINKLNISERKDTCTKDDYILVYSLADINLVLDYALRLAKLKNFKVYFIGKTLKKYANVRYFDDIGPIEFIDLFYNANYIVTNSFHGTAFSVNFKKQFVSIRHSRSPERAENFLKQVGLQRRLVENYKILEDITNEEFNKSMKKLEQIREESKKFLEVFESKDEEKKVPIVFKNKYECCGCTACFSICPTNAIEMIADEEGFKYPFINKEKCIKCELCIEVCIFKKDQLVKRSN